MPKNVVVELLFLDPALDVRLLSFKADRNIDSFCISDCPIMFRFQRDHSSLYAYSSLYFDFLNNRSRMSGEEILLRGLYELVTGANKHTIAVSTFGRDWTQQSRAFKWFILHLFQSFKHLVVDNLEWWFRNGFLSYQEELFFLKCEDLSQH